MDVSNRSENHLLQQTALENSVLNDVTLLGLDETPMPSYLKVDNEIESPVRRETSVRKSPSAEQQSQIKKVSMDLVQKKLKKH
jgi:hypothetical protein